MFGVAGSTAPDALPAARGAVQGLGEMQSFIPVSNARSVAPETSVVSWATLSAPVLALRLVGPVEDRVRERVDERGMVERK